MGGEGKLLGAHRRTPHHLWREAASEVKVDCCAVVVSLVLCSPVAPPFGFCSRVCVCVCVCVWLVVISTVLYSFLLCRYRCVEGEHRGCLDRGPGHPTAPGCADSEGSSSVEASQWEGAPVCPMVAVGVRSWRWAAERCMSP